MSEIRSQATPASDDAKNELATSVLELLNRAAQIGTPGRAITAHLVARGLTADGWSKPRTVNSAAELDGLKPGTVLRFPDGEIGMIMVTHDKRHVIGYPGILPTAELADASQHCFGDGITVLFTPGDAG